MAFNVTAIRESIRNLIEKNNTTTSSYNISANLEVKVKAVKKGFSKNKPIANNQYPIVWVELPAKTEEPIVIGRTSNRDILMAFNIRCATFQGIGQFDGREQGDEEMYILSNNIEALFRGNIKVSNTVEWAIVKATQYDVEEFNETWQSVADTTLEVYKKTKS